MSPATLTATAPAASDLLRVASIDVEGLKSRDGLERLGALTLVTGPMGAGKTRLSDALRFALLGYVPAQGKQEAATARLMRGNELRVRVTLSDGRWFERSLARVGKSYTSDAVASWLPTDANATEHGEAIRALAGASDVEAEECLDLRALLSASPNERAKRIEQILDATALSQDDQRHLLYALPVFRLAGLPDERIPQAPAEAADVALPLAQTLPAAQREALASATTAALNDLRTRGAAEALKAATEAKNTERTRARGKQQARKEIEDREGQAPSVTLDALSAQRQQRTDRLAEIRAQVRAHEEARGAREAAEAAQRDADVALATLVEAGEPGARAADLRAKATTAREQAAALVEPAPVPALVVAEESGTEAERWMQLEEQAAELERSISEPVPAPVQPALHPEPTVDVGAIARAQQALAHALESPWDQVRVQAALVAAFTVPEGQVEARDDVAATMRRLADKHGGDTKALADAVRAAETTVTAQHAERARVRQANADIQAIHAENVKGWEALQETTRETRRLAGEARKQATATRDAERARVAKLNAERKEAHRRATIDRAVAVDAVAQQRKALTNDAARLEREASDLIQAWTTKAAAVAEACARLDGMAVAAPLDLDGAQRETADLERQVATIDEQRRAVQAADARRRELSALATELSTAQALAEAWTAIEWALQRIRERDLAARGTGLVSRMAAFLKAAGRPEVPFLRAAKGRVDFGWSRGGLEIPIEALSGGESVLASAALAGAILALRKPPLRVLLIEGAEVGPFQASALMAGCEALRADIGNVLVATLLEVEPREGWDHIEVTAGQPATTGEAA